MRTLAYFLFPCALLLGFASNVHGQFAIAGQVTDAQDNPLIGASVAILGSAQGTVTDESGHYELTIPGADAVLVFSYTGYKNQEHRVDAASSQLDVRLMEAFTQLDEIVVTGLASGMARSNLAHAVATVPGKAISGITVPTTTDAALYGKFTGVDIAQASGAPGGGLAFRLRGPTSINGLSQPLIIVDGIFIDNSSIPAGLSPVTRSDQGGSRFNQDNPSNRWADLDPNDIEKIEVLKGPSAAAMYGSRSSGGVVIITTKRGEAGRTRLTLDQSFGQAEMINPLGVRQWTEERVLNSSFADDIDQFRQASEEGRLRNYEDLLYGHKGRLSNTRLSVSGGNDQTTFFAAGSYKDEEGIVTGTGYERISARANIDHRVNDWLELDLSTNYIHASADRGFFNNDNSGATMGISLSSTPAWADLLPNENGIFPDNPYAPSNFLQTAALVTNNERVNRFLGGATLRARLVRSDRHLLDLIVRGGADYYNLVTTALFPNSLQFQSNGNGLNGVSIQGHTNNLNANVSSFMVYTYHNGRDVSLKTQIGLTREDFRRNTVLAEASNLIGSQTNLDQSGTRNLSQDRLVQKDRGFFLQEEFNWRDRLILTVGLRADKSSNNSDANQLFYYPKASAAVNLHDILHTSAAGISHLKVRAAYGQSGNFAAFGSKFSAFNSAIVDGRPGMGISNQLGNAEVGPERQEEIETGLDLGFFGNRLLLDVTYYDRQVKDLLLNAQVPSSSGFESRVTNAAELRNRGLEAGLSAQFLKTDQTDWSVRLGWWRNRSTVTELLVPAFTFGGFADFLGQYRIQEGRSPTEIVGVAEGSDQLVVLGDAQPDFQMSLYNQLRWKRFDFSFLFHWKQGGDNINLSTLLFDLNETTHDFDQQGLDPSGELADGPYRLSQIGVNTAPYIEDASYLRLRELGLYYTFPEAFTGGAGNLRVGISGTNLLNFFGYNGYDPEASNFGTTGLSSSVDVMPFPSSRRYHVHLGYSF